jgi:hypothetical protein
MLRSITMSLLIFASACESPGIGDPTVVTPDHPEDPIATPSLGMLHLRVDTAEAFVGGRRQLVIDAFDTSGLRMDSDHAAVTSSDPAVVSLELRTSAVRDAQGYTTHQLFPLLSLVAPGTATVRVTLGGTTRTMDLHVAPLPPATSALVVDSFSVVEYRPCDSGCSYLAYAPLLRLREPTGIYQAKVVGVEFSLGSLTTGMCRGSLPYSAGEAAHVNRIDPYLWGNDLIFVRLDGAPLPDGVAKARVIVRDASGAYGLVETSGPVRRMDHDSLPRPSASDAYWSCS